MYDSFSVGHFGVRRRRSVEGVCDDEGDDVMFAVFSEGEKTAYASMSILEGGYVQIGDKS